MPECVNLRQRFGDTYRIAVEESYDAEYGHGAKVEDPWYDLIPCEHGHIFPWGGDKLAASTNQPATLHGTSVARRLMRMACTKVAQNGTDGVTVLFDVAYFNQVAEIMQAKRLRGVRKLEDARRQRLADDGQPFRFGDQDAA